MLRARPGRLPGRADRAVLGATEAHGHEASGIHPSGATSIARQISPCPPVHPLGMPNALQRGDGDESHCWDIDDVAVDLDHAPTASAKFALAAAAGPSQSYPEILSLAPARFRRTSRTRCPAQLPIAARRRRYVLPPLSLCRRACLKERHADPRCIANTSVASVHSRRVRSTEHLVVAGEPYRSSSSHLRAALRRGPVRIGMGDGQLPLGRCCPTASLIACGGELRGRSATGDR